MSAPNSHTPSLLRQPAAVAILLAIAVYGAGWAVHAARAPEWLTGALAAVIAAAVLSLVLAHTGPGVTAGYALACTAAAGGWLAYAGASSPTTWLAIAALAGAATILAAAYPLVRRHQQRLAEEARRRAAEAARLAEEHKWPDLLRRLGYPGTSFRSQTRTRSGHTIRLGLPANGKVRYSTLAAATERIEIAARLRHGAVQMERGGRADEVLLHLLGHLA